MHIHSIPVRGMTEEEARSHLADVRKTIAEWIADLRYPEPGDRQPIWEVTARAMGMRKGDDAERNQLQAMCATWSPRSIALCAHITAEISRATNVNVANQFSDIAHAGWGLVARVLADCRRYSAADEHFGVYLADLIDHLTNMDAIALVRELANLLDILGFTPADVTAWPQ